MGSELSAPVGAYGGAVDFAMTPAARRKRFVNGPAAAIATAVSPSAARWTTSKSLSTRMA